MPKRSEWITENSRVYRRVQSTIEYAKQKVSVYLYDPHTGKQEAWHDLPVASWQEAQQAASAARLEFAAGLRAEELYGPNWEGTEWVGGRIRALGGD